MTQVQRLNLKFSVADTDQIKQLCANRMTDQQIVVWFKRMRKRDITAEEVGCICREAGQFVRIGQMVPPDTRGMSARLMGEPVIGRRAIDQKKPE